MSKLNLLVLAFIILVPVSCNQNNQSEEKAELFEEPKALPVFTLEIASNFATIALHCVHRQYPNKLSHVMNDSSEVLDPETLHPAFYGCFDWHSSVHGHWMLVSLLKFFPDLPEGPAIREALSENLRAANIEAEVAYLYQPNRASFERTYGWSWLLKLAAELYLWDDPDGEQWLENLEPLALAIADRYIEFLPRQEYPIRRGVHPNTAFGLSFALDYARISGHTKLETAIISRAKKYFINDQKIAARWEPDGDDFLSPSLVEADLMSRILNTENFTAWFNEFLPEAVSGKPDNVFSPVSVSDRSDPKIVHLDGLNLSRAWCMFHIAGALSEGHKAIKVLRASAARHGNATLPFIASGNYEGEHWLASFAVYMFACMEE